MDESKKYQKLDLSAILDDVQKGNYRWKDAAIRQHANFFEIHTNQYSFETDEVITASLMLFGIHNALRIESVAHMPSCKGLILQGSVYEILPKYYVKGETVGSKDIVLYTTPPGDE